MRIFLSSARHASTGFINFLATLLRLVVRDHFLEDGGDVGEELWNDQESKAHVNHQRVFHMILVNSVAALVQKKEIKE